MKTRILFLDVLLVLTVGIATGLAQIGGPSNPNPQVIQLKDGTRLTFLGVTHGGNQTAPGYEDLATANRIYTGEDTTVVWVEAEHKPGQWPDYELLVYDEAKTAGVHTGKSTSSRVKDGVDFQGFMLPAFPRRDSRMIVRAKPYDGPVGDGQFVVTNDLKGPFPEWMPEALPITKSDGDFEVTLTNFVACVPVPQTKGAYPWGPDRGLPPDDPGNQCVQIGFDFRQNGRAVTNWYPRLITTTDATGNKLTSWIAGWSDTYPPKRKENRGYYYRSGLWPEEAWKVRLEFTRSSGFDSNEIITFTNLPVKSGDQQDWDDEWNWDGRATDFMDATVNGVHLNLLAPLLVPDRYQPGQKRICVNIGADPNPSKQMRLTILQATDDQGRDLWAPLEAVWTTHYVLDFANVRETKTLTLKLALHKSRFAEFTVKPGEP